MENKVISGSTAVSAAKNPSTLTKKLLKSNSKLREKPSHPRTSEMVNAAIKELKDRKGSSLQAIKKYIATTYKVDREKFAPFIKKYLKSAVTSGAVLQTKGKGASGSFKLSSEKNSKEKSKGKSLPKKIAAKKAAQSAENKAVSKKINAKKSLASMKVAAEKKSLAPKKTAAKRKLASTKTVAKVTSKSSTESRKMPKAKRNIKAPAAKTKVPKPKKAAVSKTVKFATKK